MPKEAKKDLKKDAELSRVDKAAIVLYSLGEEIASEIMKFLDHDDVREISKSMTQMAGVSGKKVDETMDEFYRLVSDEGGVLVTFSEDYVKNLISKVVGE